MNKIILLAVVTLVACANLTQGKLLELSFVSTNEDGAETAQVDGDKKIFRGYCLQIRDDIQDFLEHHPNSRALSMVSEAMAPTAEGKAGFKRARGMDALHTYVDRGIEWAEGAIYHGIFQRVIWGEFRPDTTEIKKQIKSENYPEALRSACLEFDSTVVPMAESALSKVKEDLSKSNRFSKSEEFAKLVNETSYANVNCLTTRRLMRVSRGCRIMKDHWDEVARVQDYKFKGEY